MDAHRLRQFDAVVVNMARRLKRTVLPGSDDRTHTSFGDVTEFIEGAEAFCEAEFLQENRKPPLPETSGAELPSDIAQYKFGRTAIGCDDALDIAEGFEFSLVAHRR